jgi:hypothetical protein
MILTLTKESKYVLPRAGKVVKAEICEEAVDKVYFTVNDIEIPYYWVHKEVRRFEVPLLLEEGDVLGLSGDAMVGVEIELF